MSCQACCLVKLLPRRPLLHLTSGQLLSWLMTQEPLSGFSYPICTGPYSLDPRSNSPIDRVVVATGSGLKFYNLHQTLNTSINALNSFTDIYLISSARIGFVFFISFTNFFLIVIVPLYPTLLYLSSLVLGACCLVKSRVSL